MVASGAQKGRRSPTILTSNDDTLNREWSMRNEHGTAYRVLQDLMRLMSTLWTTYAVAAFLVAAADQNTQSAPSFGDSQVSMLSDNGYVLLPFQCLPHDDKNLMLLP